MFTLLRFNLWLMTRHLGSPKVDFQHFEHSHFLPYLFDSHLRNQDMEIRNFYMNDVAKVHKSEGAGVKNIMYSGGNKGSNSAMHGQGSLPLQHGAAHSSSTVDSVSRTIPASSEWVLLDSFRRLPYHFSFRTGPLISLFLLLHLSWLCLSIDPLVLLSLLQLLMPARLTLPWETTSLSWFAFSFGFYLFTNSTSISRKSIQSLYNFFSVFILLVDPLFAGTLPTQER
jgi:hypothetical protein